MVWARLQTPWSEITSPTASGSRRGDSRPYLIRAMTEPLIPKDRIPWRHLALFGWLPSPLKILAYRLLLGYRIGRGVRFSFGGIVVGKVVEIGDHVEIGFLAVRSEEHTSELQSPCNLVCRLLLEKKKNTKAA